LRASERGPADLFVTPAPDIGTGKGNREDTRMRQDTVQRNAGSPITRCVTATWRWLGEPGNIAVMLNLTKLAEPLSKWFG
jgi:hypothetical protein